MKFYEIDPFEEARELIDNQREDKKLKKKLEKLFTPESFSKKWKSANIAGLVLSYICNILSGLTAFIIVCFLIQKGLEPAFGSTLSTILASVLATIIILIGETIKRSALDNFLRGFIQFRRFSFALLGLVFLVCSLSVLTSFYGAKQIPKTISNLIGEKELDTIKVIGEYNVQIAKLEKKAEAYFENNKKPNAFEGFRLSSKYMPTYNNMEKDLSNLRKKREEVLEEVRGTYKAEKAEQSKDFEGLAWTLGYFSLLVELIFISSILGTWLYYWGSYKEQNISQAQFTESIDTEEKARIDSRFLPKICAYCGEEYKHNHVRQKFCSIKCKNAKNRRKRKLIEE